MRGWLRSEIRSGRLSPDVFREGLKRARESAASPSESSAALVFHIMRVGLEVMKLQAISDAALTLVPVALAAVKANPEMLSSEIVASEVWALMTAEVRRRESTGDKSLDRAAPAAREFVNELRRAVGIEVGA